VYSGTSLKGLSELRTQYKKPPYLGHVLQSHWYHANTFLPLIEENLYITAKLTQKPKVLIIKRFHSIYYGLSRTHTTLHSYQLSII